MPCWLTPAGKKETETDRCSDKTIICGGCHMGEQTQQREIRVEKKERKRRTRTGTFRLRRCRLSPARPGTRPITSFPCLACLPLVTNRGLRREGVECVRTPCKRTIKRKQSIKKLGSQTPPVRGPRANLTNQNDAHTCKSQCDRGGIAESVCDGIFPLSSSVLGMRLAM